MDEGKKPGKRSGFRSLGVSGVLSFGVLIGLPLTIYSRTLSPTVNFIDSGELISVAYHLGIAHPTGYPLFTLLGRLVALLGSSNPASALNFMSALLGSAAAVLVGVVVFLATGCPDKRPESALPGGPRYVVAAVSGLLFAFSRTMWQVSTQTEVYSLAALLLVLLLLVAWPLIARKGDGYPRPADRGRRVFPLLGYVWGMAMGNHLSVVLLSPLVLYIFYRGRVWEKSRRWSVFSFSIAFLLGFSIYLYIPVRSMEGPVLNWGRPDGLDSFIRHITAWQYRTWMFTGGWSVFLQKVTDYIRLLLGQFHPIFLVLVPAGGFHLFRHNRSLLAALAIVFLSNLFYSLNYDIPDIDPYFIPSFIVTVIFIGAGVHQLVLWFSGKGKGVALALSLVSAVIPLEAIHANYRICDRSRDFMAYELATNLLSTVSEGSVVLTRTWDLYAPVLYQQLIEGKRRDVVMIDYELMRRSWYVEELMERHGDRFASARSEVDRFLDLVADFEAGRDYDSRKLDLAFHAMLNEILLAGFPERAAYVDFDDNAFIAPALRKDPHGVIFQLREEYREVSTDISGYRLTSTLDRTLHRDERELWIRSFYPRYALKEGIILREMERFGEAVKSFENARSFRPDDPVVLHLLGDTYFRMGSLSQARDWYRKLVETSPADVNARKRLDEIEKRIGRHD